MAQILVIGGVSYNDLVYLQELPEPRAQTIFSQKHHATVGGTGAGKAFNLNRLGHQVTLHSPIGADAAGELVKRRFQEEGVTFVPEIDPLGTERHINLMDASGDRISIYVNYATRKPQVDYAQLEGLVIVADIVVLNIINYGRYTIPLLKKHAKPIWCDIHNYDGESYYYDEFIAAADVLLMSSEQLPDYPEFMQTMIAKGKELVICTHGKDGATALSKRGVWGTVPALTTELVDSNGAGDSFFSGVLHGYLQNLSLQTCLEYGAIAASLCVNSPELYSEQLSAEHIATLHHQYFGE
jgi:sugar/nucleoside kinase (ribokinase family)